jgi:hypothetical protein
MRSPLKGRKSGAVERFTRSMLNARQRFTRLTGLTTRISSGCCDRLSGESFRPVCAPINATATTRLTDCRGFDIWLNFLNAFHTL